MVRYIDADALQAEILGLTITENTLQYANAVSMIIADAPTVDVAPVHGEWIRHDETQRYFNVEWNCSVCGEQIQLSGILTPKGAGWNYCPNCGAKMDGGKDAEE